MKYKFGIWKYCRSDRDWTILVESESCNDLEKAEILFAPYRRLNINSRGEYLAELSCWTDDENLKNFKQITFDY